MVLLAVSYSITNFTEHDLPTVISDELIKILTHLKDNFPKFKTCSNHVGTIDDLLHWDDWSTDRKFSIDRKLLSVNLLEHSAVVEQLKTLTNGGKVSGAFLYPPDGWMGWHTNSSTYPKDTRLYITHNDNEGSVFLYRKGNKTFYLEEPKGWSIKYFDVTKSFWHAVISKSNRHSFGFRYLVLNNE